jgi:hypothetical protein
MKVTLEFNDEEHIEAKQAFNGGSAHGALWDIKQLLRGKAKNFDEISAEQTYQDVLDIIREFNINLDE